tara:strand:+ start:806 stop:1195 length:390 start_codon:yes stop_codon:yes gene_type:complete
MLHQLVYLMIACVPRRNEMCTREFNPVCGNATTYNNQCLARAAGFYGACEQNLRQGACETVNSRNCASNEFFSEKGMCVTKPWSDFNSCEEEKLQGACPNGNDPNPWVGEHCAQTCGVYVRTSRENDGR